jgi:hypothetical protein
MHWLLAILHLLLSWVSGNDRTAIRMAARRDGRLVQIPRRPRSWTDLQQWLCQWLPKLPGGWFTPAATRRQRPCIDLGLPSSRTGDESL